MSFASKVLYTGDAVTTDFTVTFPYISQSHVNVYVNEILQLTTMNYNWSGPSTISFVDAPAIDDAIEIKRWTSPSALLVDYVDGSTLRATDLDTAYQHTFFLSQEYADSFNEIINEALLNVATGTGIVETETDEVIAALVNEMLNSANAANLQARISDIDANAEAIITLGESLQVQVNTLASGVAAAVWIQATEPVPGVGGVPNPIPEGSRWYDSDDNNAPYIYQSSAWYSIDDPRIGNNEAAITALQVETGDNAAAIVAEALLRSNADSATASELHLLGAQNVGQTAFILDLNTAHVGVGESLADRFTQISADWGAGDAAVSAEVTAESTARANADTALASDITLLTADVGSNAADILTEQTARASGDSANASAIAAVSTTVDGNTASITTNQTSINGIETSYGVELNANGYVQGFRIINGGVAGENAFVIVADRFAISNGGVSDPDYVPFEIVGTKINMRADVQIDGDLLVSGTINGQTALNALYPLGSTLIGPNAITTTQLNANSVTAVKILANAVTAEKINVTNLAAVNADMGSITAGNITLNTAGYIKGGQTAYNTGTGFFLGYDGTDYKFSIGDGVSNYMTWDGTELLIKGNLIVGEYESSDNIILSATTERSDSGPYGAWQTYKTFTVAKDGVVKLTFETRQGTLSNIITNGTYQVTVNSSQVATGATNTTSYVTKSHTLSGLSAGDVIDINLKGGEQNPLEPIPFLAYVRNAYVKADVVIAPGGSVDLD